MVEAKSLTIEIAYRELQSIEHQIDLYQTQRAITNNVKAVNLKQILVSGGKLNNNAILDGIITCDKFSDKLNALYQSKSAYEQFIWKEIELYKDVKQGLIISFLKNYLKMSWDKIIKVMNYSKAQCKRYYAEYKGYTPQNNTFLKNEPK